MKTMEWISVKDKLPESGVKVLCFVSRKQIIETTPKYEMHVGHKPSSQNFWIVGNMFSFDLGEVTHWQNLPEPPK